MRKLILLIAISVSALAASAQNSANVTSTALKQSKSNGVYVYKLSDNITQKEVSAAAKYYEQYFTTAFDAAKHEAKLTLTENADIDKRVMQRFLISLNISEVTVDGKSQPFETVYEAYMK